MSGTIISRGEVYVVDDDAATREALSRALRDAGYEVIHFADGAALLTETRVRTPACIFLDAHVEGRPLELLKKLRIEDCPAPIFVASAQANIPLAVDAIKSGAFDFVKKPFCVSEIVARVDAAIGAQIHIESLEGIKQISRRLSGEVRLTKRERDVFAFIAMGKTNKETARELGLSARTVEGYRATIMRKVGARSATDLVRRVLDNGRGD
ncbi:response regulator [Bradyrhizobium sp. Tv2a-2]|uniref:response regulator transcription factor n=1 Tax=Bradyrhizobium sp. Tv2a-2 TaxID=113395 RepID=UPI00041F3298|nr:response regulator [Bradyrhizobium sp. Tv2a-2]